MTLQKKIDLLGLSEEEKNKLTGKFLITLGLITETEYLERLNFLSSKGVKISKAKEIKILGNTLEELIKRFNIIEEIHESNIYVQNPLAINSNPLDLHRRLLYCRQNGIQYIDENGMYKKFLFSEKLFAEINKQNDVTKIVEEVPTFEPVIEEPIISVEPEFKLADPILEVNEPVIGEDIANMKNDLDEIDAKTTNFATLRKDLTALRDELANINTTENEMNFNSVEEEISFDNLDDFSFGGRAA